MSDTLVIDTNIFAHAAGAGGDESVVMNCLGILYHLNKDNSIKLAVDTENEILDEYKKNLKKHNTSHSKLIKKFIQKEAYRSSGERRIKSYVPIRKREVEELLSKGFDNDDIKFVRIAPKTDFKIIASSDTRSFLKEEYKDWLREELDVETMSEKEFLEFLDS